MFSDDDESNSIENDLETDFLIHPMDKEKQVLPYALYFKMLAYENHYATLSLRYKKLCLTWILAGFIAIGATLSKEFLEAATPLKILIICILCLISIKGIAILWFTDIAIYQQFMSSIATEASLLEKKFNFLPKLCTDTKILMRGKKNPLFYQSLFYACCIFLFLSAMNIGLYNNLALVTGKTFAAIVSGILLCLYALALLKIVNVIVKKLSRTTQNE